MPPLAPLGRAGGEKHPIPISPRGNAPVTPSHDDFPEIGFALSDPPPVNDWLDDKKDRINYYPSKQVDVESSPVPPEVDKQATADGSSMEEPKASAAQGTGDVRWAATVVETSVENSVERSGRSRSTTKTESDYPGYVDLNSCRLGDAIDALISVPIIILQIIWITMEDQESTEGTIYYWTAAGMEIYLLLELWGYVLIGEVTPMSLLSLWLIRKLRSRYKFTFMPFPDVIRRISRFMLGLSLIANTALSFWPGVNDLIPLALSVQLWLALMASAGMNQ